MVGKLLYLLAAITAGFIFNQLNIPAGWLLGALTTGMICGIFINRFTFKRISFKFALAFVGANISLLLTLSTLKMIHHFLLPLFLTIIITITAGFLFGIFLFKRSKGVDKITAFFCCIPGGASEIIGISGQYGADDRLVAAFHTVRMTFFTLSIPLIVASISPAVQNTVFVEQAVASISWKTVLFFALVMAVTLVLDHLFKIPGGTLVFSILIGFLLTQFVFGVEQVPRFVAGIGQALIGAFVGIRFDKYVLYQILKIGPATLTIVGMFFVLTLGNAYIFKWLTEVPFATSLISTVPAGAAEMSVVAIALNVDPTIVTSLHIIRVISLFLTLPFLLKFFMYLNKEYREEDL
ncbi:AbrB family transcriptional regulator [Oceanobacillus saliphilus]|uniref:AbrB family transcriptional regulator n=1 Tax=Oceanobacillus saliphilus TaxID=2925834 RepID=UPI00201E6E24|nr:AbrB family transcriptional regulator [Oceanobacillus saliphilus]